MTTCPALADRNEPIGELIRMSILPLPTGLPAGPSTRSPASKPMCPPAWLSTSLSTCLSTCLSTPVTARAPVTMTVSGTPSSPPPRGPGLSRLYRKALIGLSAALFLAATPSFADSLPDFKTLVEQEGDAVVKIQVVTEGPVATASRGEMPPGFDQLPEELRRYFEGMPQGPQGRPPESRRGGGFGSGFIISDDGYILTNAHVVDNATEIRVGLDNRREYEAELVGSDPTTDVALLKITAGRELPIVRIGDSDTLSVGEWVLAIGSPFGFEATATQGIVSALSRSLPSDNYVPFIQTDVAVNPGNSGGPLFNTDGEVVGINSQIYSRSGGYQGLSFAIPINVAMGIADQLKDQGFATRGWLGVAIQNVDQALAESFGLSRPQGALVADVSDDSPAAKAELKRGDIILQFDGRPVGYSSALPPLVGAITPGATVPVQVLRDGEELTLDVTIEPLDEERIARADPRQEEGQAGRLGVAVAAMTDEQREESGIASGVIVSEVTPGSAAAEAGIVKGDVILALNRQDIDSPQALSEAVKGAPGDTSVPVLVQRGSSPTFLALTLPDADS